MLWVSFRPSEERMLLGPFTSSPLCLCSTIASKGDPLWGTYASGVLNGWGFVFLMKKIKIYKIARGHNKMNTQILCALHCIMCNYLQVVLLKARN